MRSPSRLLCTPSRISVSAFRQSLSALHLQRTVVPLLRWQRKRVPHPSETFFSCLASQKRFCRTMKRSTSSATTSTSQPHTDVQMAVAATADGRNQAFAVEDDDVTIRIYRPQVSPKEAERKLKTDLFLCLLLTLPKAQDWKDMLTAAFRADTWRPHHLDAVLRGVLLNKYNEPSAFLLSCVGASSANTNKDLRESAVEASQMAPSTSTATSRLHRARDILVFCAEEGVLYSRSRASAEMIEKSEEFLTFSSSSHGSLSEDADRSGPLTSDTFLPSSAAAHHLLAMLLQAAQRSTEYTTLLSTASKAASSIDSNNGISALPTASYADVWHYLAWMELHGYHVLSYTVLDALEAAVDESSSSASSLTHDKGTSSDLSVFSAASSTSPLQYALVSQRVHRFDYLRRERALLQEALRNKTNKGGDQSIFKERRDSGAQRRKRPDVPRTDPNA